MFVVVAVYNYLNNISPIHEDVFWICIQNNLFNLIIWYDKIKLFKERKEIKINWIIFILLLVSQYMFFEKKNYQTENNCLLKILIQPLKILRFLLKILMTETFGKLINKEINKSKRGGKNQ